MKPRSTLPWALAVLTWLCMAPLAIAGDSLTSIFSEGKVSGNVRSYLNIRDFDSGPDQGAYALGGVIRGETAPMRGVSIGGAFYVSDDLGTKHDDDRRVLGTLPESLEVIGEAYVKLSYASTQLTAGRIKIDTPFANPSDAFIVPITFEGIGIRSQPMEGVTLEGYYLTRFKNRSDEKFLDAGDFVGSRLAGLNAAQASDGGTAIAGASWGDERTKVSVFGYLFTDYFATGYVEARHTFPAVAGIAPYIGAQYIYQREVGDDDLSQGTRARVAGREVDGQSAGALAGATLGAFDLSFAYNHVARSDRSLLGGAILAPYSFATSPVFTNSMVDTLENTDSGSAYKVTLGWKWAKRIATKLSVASYERDVLTDSVETDVDVTYSFSGRMDGLSFRVRLGVVQSSDRARRVTNLRTQLQYLF